MNLGVAYTCRVFHGDDRRTDGSYVHVLRCRGRAPSDGGYGQTGRVCSSTWVRVHWGVLACVVYCTVIVEVPRP